MQASKLNPPNKTAGHLWVFLFTDLVDSTALARRLGDLEYVKDVLEPHNKLFRNLLAEYEGAEEVKHLGDGFMATFAAASDAAEFSLRLHQAMRAYDWKHGAVRTRVGINIGEAVEFAGATDSERDLTGDAANMAARIMGLAEAEQTLMSRSAFDSARQSGRVQARWLNDSGEAIKAIKWLNHGPFRMKGADEPLEVCEVGVDGLAPLRPPPDSEKAKRVVSSEEAELLGWRPSPGTIIPHRPDWTLQQTIGSGGFGEVWVAQHQRTRERRAFKFCFDIDRLRTFKRELTFFRLIRDHLGDRPDMVRLFEVHVDSPPFYLEGEFVPGGNLKDWSDGKGGIQTLPLNDRLEMLAQISASVSAAHSLGIIHKDLKPSNILIAEQNGRPHPKLTDFGIGVLSDRRLLQQHQITDTGFTESILLGNDSSRTGTRMYQPPEAQLNQPASIAGDVYALGVMLYQMVIGDFSRPFGIGWEDDVEDPLLRDDIQACTRRDLARRLKGAEELAIRLRSLPERRAEREAGLRAEQQSRRVRQLRIGLVISVVCLAILCGFTLFSFLQWQRAEGLSKRALAGESEAVRQAKAAEDARAEAVRNATVAQQQTELAEERLSMTTRATYNLQLQRARDLWQTDPGECLALLEDADLCPESLRDFSWKLLHDLVTRNRRLLRGHRGPVRALEFVPGNSQLVSGGYDGSLRLWNLSDQSAKPLWHDPEYEIEALAIAEDGKTVVFAHGHHAYLFNLASEQVLRKLFMAEMVGTVAISPDGKWVAGGDPVGNIIIWNAETGDQHKRLTGHRNRVHGLCFSHDNRLLGSASHDQIAAIWDVESGELKNTLNGHSRCVRTIAFSPSDETIATASEDETLELWDVASGEPLQSVPLKDGGAMLRYAANGDFVVVVDQGRHLRIIRLDDAESQRTINASHSSPTWGLAISRDSRLVATGSDDGMIVVSNLSLLTSDQQELAMDSERFVGQPAMVSQLAFARDGTWMAIGQEDQQTVVVWDVALGQARFTLKGHLGLVRSVAISPDDRWIASGSNDRTVRIWDAQSGELVHKLSGHKGNVSGLCFSKDGTRLFASTEDRDRDGSQGQIWIWDIATQQAKQVLDSAMKEIWTMALSPDERFLAIGGGDNYSALGGSLAIWDLATERENVRYEDGEMPLALTFSPDSSQLVSGDKQGKISFWTVPDFKCRKTVLAHNGLIHQLVFAENGQTLASAGHDGNVKLWDPVLGLQRVQLVGHRGCVRTLVFSPDQQSIYSGSEDRSLRRWGGVGIESAFAESIGEQLADSSRRTRRRLTSAMVLRGHQGTVGSVSVDPKSGIVASVGEDDHVVRIWDLKKRESVRKLTDAPSPLRSVRVLENQQVLATCADANVYVWDLKTDEPARVMEGHSRYVACTALDAQRDRLFTGAEDHAGGGELFRWQLSSFEKQAELLNTQSNPLMDLLVAGRSEEIWALDASPDGKFLISGGGSVARGDIMVWDLENGKLAGHLIGAKARVRAVRFNASGDRLYAADESGTVTVYSWPDRKPIHAYAAHQSYLYDLGLSADGKWMATASGDYLIRIWNCETFKEVAALDGHVGPVRSIHLYPDATRLISGSEDETVRVWDLKPNEWE